MNNSFDKQETITHLEASEDQNPSSSAEFGNNIENFWPKLIEAFLNTKNNISENIDKRWLNSSEVFLFLWVHPKLRDKQSYSILYHIYSSISSNNINIDRDDSWNIALESEHKNMIDMDILNRDYAPIEAIYDTKTSISIPSELAWIPAARIIDTINKYKKSFLYFTRSGQKPIYTPDEFMDRYTEYHQAWSLLDLEKKNLNSFTKSINKKFWLSSSLHHLDADGTNIEITPLMWEISDDKWSIDHQYYYKIRIMSEWRINVLSQDNAIKSLWIYDHIDDIPDEYLRIISK